MMIHWLISMNFELPIAQEGLEIEFKKSRFPGSFVNHSFVF